MQNVASMPQPAPRLDDDALVAELLARVPEAGTERRVRSLLAAWWRYAGVRNAAGAVVDSDTFIAERGALGLLELPGPVAARLIQLEFALLHDPAAAAAQRAPEPSAAAPEPPAPTVAEPVALRVVPPPVEEPPVDVLPPIADIPAPAAAPAIEPAPEPQIEPEVVASTALEPIAIAPVEELELDAEAVPISAFEAFQEVRERTRDQAQTAVMAGFIVFFSVVVGSALALGQQIDHLALPGAASEPLVAGWRAFLAIVAGFGGAAVGLVAATRLAGRRRALVAPTTGLFGLGVLGLGLLSGSMPFLGAGAAVFALGGVAALLRR
jgi:hypothetical protein